MSQPLPRSLQSLATPRAGRSRGRGRGAHVLSCSMQIRSDTSQILEENIPLLKAKVVEMRGIYAKVDQLEVSRG